MMMRRLIIGLLLSLTPISAFADSQGSAVGGTRGTQSTLSGGTYNSAAPTLTNGQQVGLQVDSSGNLKTTSSGGGGATNATIVAPLGPQTQAASVATTSAVATTLAPAVVALSTTAGVVLAASPNPVSRTVCNDDAAITEYFGPSSVTNAGANGVKLTAGQCWDFSHNTAAIYGVSASATPNARVVQY